MKKIFTLIAGASLLTGIAFGQSQRLVLVEEFTGETCGPCAAQNPGFNGIMDANAAKGVAIKYQNNIPSTGPNFWLYNTADVNARATYLGATGTNSYSPHGYMDGNLFNDVIGNYTAAMLNSRYAVTSPFDVIVSHTLSAGGDSIFTHTVIRATQAVSGTLAARVVVVESKVYGYTSPNGESDYSNVMRKMLPTPAGTPLASSFAVGDSAVIDLAWAIAASPTSYAAPAPLQLKVIAFVQDETTKEVLQAGLDNNAVTLDPAVNSVTNYTGINCSGSVSPTVTIGNEGPVTLTSIDVQYTLDAGTTQTYAWTGSLAQGASATVSLPTITVAAGSHFLNVTVANPNGSPDQVPQNSTSVINFGLPYYSMGNVTEDFATTTFPPNNWVLENNNLDAATWTRSTAGHNGAGSAKMDFYNSAAGRIDILDIVKGLDLSTATTADLTFDLAHRQYSAQYSDNLKVEVSTDCGLSWTTIYTKSGATLATVTGYVTGEFVPTAAQWRNEAVSLSNYLGQSNVMLRYKATSGYGNQAYIDNVNISVTTGVNEILNASTVNIYPTIVQDKLNVNVNFTESQNASIIVTDVLGKQVNSLDIKNATKGNYVIDMNKVSKGTYFVTISSDKNTYTKKVSKN